VGCRGLEASEGFNAKKVDAASTARLTGIVGALRKVSRRYDHRRRLPDHVTTSSEVEREPIDRALTLEAQERSLETAPKTRVRERLLALLAANTSWRR
jgi:hypothetical protein